MPSVFVPPRGSWSVLLFCHIHVRKCRTVNASTTREIRQGWTESVLARNPRECDEGDRPVEHCARLKRLLRMVSGVSGTDAYTPQSPFV
jgi:hypothetical protein